MDKPEARLSRPPARLQVQVPNGLDLCKACAGEYCLVPGLQANGWPVWKQSGEGDRWLYTGTSGHWFMASGDDNIGHDLDFNCSRGVISAGYPHNGEMPQCMNSSWERSNGIGWVGDEAISIRLPAPTEPVSLRPPPVLQVYVPRWDENCASCRGEYRLVPELKANGSPVWQQIDGDRWIYTGTNGFWHLTTDDEVGRERGFNCTRGILVSSVAHGGVMPHYLRGGWERWDGDTWLADDSISFKEHQKVQDFLGCSPTGPCSVMQGIRSEVQEWWLQVVTSVKAMGLDFESDSSAEARERLEA